MKTLSDIIHKGLPRRQEGMTTLFTAVLILFLMTVALLYSSRSALFDQRVASNEERYRTAFNMAEGAAEVTVEYLVAAPKPGIFDTSVNWQTCPDASSNICDFDIDGTVDGWYIHNAGAVFTEVADAISDLTAEQPDLAARVSVALQFRESGLPVGSNSSSVQALFMVYGYGYSDCATANTLSTCQGEASVAAPLGSFALLSGPPTVPFTSKSFFDPNGGITIVAAPNGGGVGVPVSTWLNGKETDGTHDGIDLDPGAGTWQTCEYDEWYATEALPASGTCPNQDTNNDGILNDTKPSCACTSAELLSGSLKGATQPALDILVDDTFPDDLFYTFFGTAKEDYASIKNAVTQVANCNGLDENSSGVIWVTGDCAIGANTQIGKFDSPVVLIGEGDVRINGATLFGLVFCTDAPVLTAGGTPSNGITLSGNGVVYGAIVSDCGTFNTNGTFDLVFNSDILQQANAFGGLGSVSAGWRDFDVPGYVGN